ncbi:MAG TPA: hypothetical protein VKO41_07960 [Gaiellaceae bacterium]|nr:hypothetical protein [Gaiellaceae bacterium]
MRTAEYCRECWGYKGYTDGEDVIEWIVCGRCLPRLAGRGELAGRQSAAVCLECRSPFEENTAGTEVLQLGLPGSRVACPAGRRGLLARWGKAPMSFGMATRAERAQVPRIITPAQLAGDDVIDLGGERPNRAQRKRSRLSARRRRRRHARVDPRRCGWSGQGRALGQPGTVQTVSARRAIARR